MTIFNSIQFVVFRLISVHPQTLDDLRARIPVGDLPEQVPMLITAGIPVESPNKLYSFNRTWISR
jgi:hypothetical protein